jgi:16S rRNA (uracil1498-N3)-methyltransferase
MRRFFLGDIPVAEGIITITGDLFRHMAKVLRMKEGASVVFFDGAGKEYTGTITTVESRSLIVNLDKGRREDGADCGLRITLYQGLPKGDKMEFILQKATELGVAEIIPFVATRSVAKVTDRAAQRLERWQRIVHEAARQSGRSTLPRVSPPGSIEEILRSAQQSAKFLLWEDEKDSRLKKTLAEIPAPTSIAVMVGPEGGLTAEEVSLARECGFIPLSLGNRIVRTETAGLVILSILQFYWGDIG